MTSRIVPLLLVLAACKGSGKGTLVLDEETVSTRLAEIAADVPGCDTTGGSGAARMLARVLGTAQQAPGTLRRIRDAGPLFAGTGATGACGGDVTVDFNHAEGITDYTVVFNDFCSQSEDGDVVMDGTLTGKEIGKPSDSGPVISAFEAKTDGALVVSHAGETGEIVIDEIRTDYGKPATWYPDEPDEANPDDTTISRASVTFSSDGRTEYVEDVRYLRWGGLDATYEIDRGRLGRDGEKYVAMHTTEPITVNLLGLEVTGGKVELTGAKGTTLEVSPGDAPGTFALDLNGEPFDEGLDCAAARQPLVQIGFAVLGALPLY